MRQIILGAALIVCTAASAFGLDTFIYSEYDTGRYGNWGPTGFVGPDGISRVICYSLKASPRTTTAYIYRVTIPEGTDAETHPENLRAPGAVAPRTFTLEQSFDLGVDGYSHAEFYVAERGKTIYFGPALGIHKYQMDDSGNYQYKGMVAPPAPEQDGRPAATLAYDKRTNVWYAGGFSFNMEPGRTQRVVWKYDGNQGPDGQWEQAFTYTSTLIYAYHDGLEMVNGLLYLADSIGAAIYEYTPEGVLLATYTRRQFGYRGEGMDLAGMGYGALQHFWYGSPLNTIIEFGGGVLERHEVNSPPVAVAGAPVTVTSEQLSKTIVDGSVSDPDGGPLLCRWLQGDTVIQNWAPVGPNGACPLFLAVLSPYPVGSYPLTIEGMDDNGATDQDQTTLTVTEPPADQTTLTVTEPPALWACSIARTAIGNTSWNSFKIPEGSAPKVWMHAHIGTPKGIPTDRVTRIRFSGASITLDEVRHPLPDALMIFDPAMSGSITTRYDETQKLWTTLVNPSRLSGEIFITGAAIPVTREIAAGAKATVAVAVDSEAPSLSFPWQWSAAVYTAWPSDWNDAKILPYHGSYHSGAPTARDVQLSLIAGPRGGGGSNFTGSWSATGNGSCP